MLFRSCLPCLSPLKLRTTLFLGEGATHKLKPSPYPHAAIFHLPYITLYAPHSTPLTFPLHLLDSGVTLTSSLSHSSIIPFHIHSLTSSALCILFILYLAPPRKQSITINPFPEDRGHSRLIIVEYRY